MSRTAATTWRKSRTTWLDRGWRMGGVLTCHLCGQPIHLARYASPHPLSFALDHVVPVKLGGTDDLANTAPAHRKCNGLKGSQVASM